jgi:hypothetical protein
VTSLRDRLNEATRIIEDIALLIDKDDDSRSMLDVLPPNLSKRVAAFLNSPATRHRQQPAPGSAVRTD